MGTGQSTHTICRRALAALAVLAMVATTMVLAVTSGTATASACDATVADEAALVAAVNCYNSELDGSETVVTLSGPVTLTSSLVLSNSTTATFTVNGAGNALTGVFDDTFRVDGIDVQAGHLIFTELVYNAQAKTGVRLAANTSFAATNSVLDATDAVGSVVSAGQPGTSVSLSNSSIVGQFLDGISIEGSLMMVDSTISGRSGIRGFTGSDVTVTNSTLVRPADEVEGTALLVEGTAQLTGVTIKGSRDAIVGSGAASLEGTLIADIAGTKCGIEVTITNAGGNTVPDATCGDIEPTEFPSSAGLGLGSPQDNGCAPTLVACPPTIAIEGINSPAIDAWPGCAFTDDQRGFARAAGACDSGAYEGFDCPGPVATAEEFEFGVQCYNRAGDGATQALSLTDNITLTQPLPLINNDSSAILAIDGAGHTLTTLDGQVGFNVADGDLRFQDLTVAGSSSEAVSLRADSNLSLIESTITGSASAIEGFADHSGTVSLLRSELVDNTLGITEVFDLTIDASTITGSSTRGLVTGQGTTAISNSTFAENDFALQVQHGTTTVVNTTFARNTPTGIALISPDLGAGTATFVDSMSFNDANDSCGDLGDPRIIDGGGNVMQSDCGPIAGVNVSPGDPDWLSLLPPLALNACEPGVTCTRTIATPAGFPTAGAARTCGLPIDQRGVTRLVTSCDAGSYEAPNQPPTAVDDIVPGFELAEDDPATVIDVLANDIDPDPGDILVVLSATQPGLGGTALVSNGQLVFTPSANFSGSAQFTYTMADGSGASAVASVVVQISAVNDTPDAVDDDISLPKNGFRRTEPAANDTDVEGSVLSIESITQPPVGEGTAALVDNRFVDYTPPIGFVGMTSFTYTVADVDGSTAIGTIFVEVTGTNALPVADPDTGDAIQNGDPILIDVLANDTDEDLDELVVLSITQPPNGRTVLRGNDVEYTPDTDFIGQDTFSYQVGDGTGESTGIVTITVADSNLNPIANEDQIDVQPGIFNVLDVLANDTDPENTELTITSVTQPVSAGEVQIAADGKTLELTAAADFVGTDRVFYIIEDEGGATSQAFAFLQSSTPQLCNGLPVTINLLFNGGNGMGTFGDDVILGTAGDDMIDGGDGNDTVCAGTGDDEVLGGDGDDMLFGEGGRDIIRGNPGQDTIDGGDGRDRLLGGIGDDTITGGEGDDFIGGFGGNDTIEGGNGDETIFGGFGADTIDGGPGDDSIFGLIGNDIISGGSGDDLLNGDRGNDTINGGPGDDTINGGNANDKLNGQAGDDSVSGGKADDALSGGDGIDICVGNLQTVADTTDGTCEQLFGVP